MSGKLSGLRAYKEYLIGCIKNATTKKEKKERNKQTRQIDKEIKRLLSEGES